MCPNSSVNDSGSAPTSISLPVSNRPPPEPPPHFVSPAAIELSNFKFLDCGLFLLVVIQICVV
ncbi:hypothetical protein A2U01_0044249 [Trifolium medium]|uniref:Uncharacterized protein n=1 Tax=Trifolium medium TaxID=97028 RepID=A0A392QFB4_9FABA|nr:hypothetical protein [Trifolium medium]